MGAGEVACVGGSAEYANEGIEFEVHRGVSHQEEQVAKLCKKKLQEVESSISFGAYLSAAAALKECKKLLNICEAWNSHTESQELQRTLMLFHFYNAVLYCLTGGDSCRGADALNSCNLVIEKESKPNPPAKIPAPKGYTHLVQAAIHLTANNRRESLLSVDRAIHLNPIPEFYAFKALIVMLSENHSAAEACLKQAAKKPFTTPLLGVSLRSLALEMEALTLYLTHLKNPQKIAAMAKKLESVASNCLRVHPEGLFYSPPYKPPFAQVKVG